MIKCMNLISIRLNDELFRFVNPDCWKLLYMFISSPKWIVWNVDNLLLDVNMGDKLANYSQHALKEGRFLKCRLGQRCPSGKWCLANRQTVDPQRVPGLKQWFILSHVASLSTAKQGDNALGSILPSVRPPVCVFVHLCALSCLNRLTYGEW